MTDSSGLLSGEDEALIYLVEAELADQDPRAFRKWTISAPALARLLTLARTQEADKAGAEIERLRAALVAVRADLFADGSVNADAITDTLWHSYIETVQDFIDAALSPPAQAVEEGTYGLPILTKPDPINGRSDAPCSDGEG